MPQSSNRNSTPLWLAFFALVIIASAWRPLAQARAGDDADLGAGAGEYAIIQFRAQDAVVFTVDGAFFMEGPEVRNQERVIGDTNLRLLRPVEVGHLTTLGLQGWEVIRPWGDGNSWLLRRAR